MYIPQTDWNRGTYRELKALLNELPEHYLDQTATVMLSESDEYTDIRSIGWTGPANQVLDSDLLATIISEYVCSLSDSKLEELEDFLTNNFGDD